MQKQFVHNPLQQTGDRIKSIDIRIPKIRAEFFVRLKSFLEVEPEVTFEGYEFYIKDTVTNKTFSAALTGFGPGYFSEENSEEIQLIIEEFHKQIFSDNLLLKHCKIEFEHDFGKTILSCENGIISELDIEE